EFVHRVMREERVVYVRGRVGRVARAGDGLRVFGTDTLSGERQSIDADMVVLATAMKPARQTNGPGRVGTLNVATDAHGFAQEAHPKLRPSETMTPGIYPIGASQYPKDIPDTVNQASAAAGKILPIFSKPELEREPMTAEVREALCVGCFDCERLCPYSAIQRKEMRGGAFVAQVNPAICEGCGACVSACRPGAMELTGFSDEQIFTQLEALTRSSTPKMVTHGEWKP
ncbi:MAG: 4Fe-4S dicluster domain-containing protein, partial [Bradymonadaceae bacterium]